MIISLSKSVATPCKTALARRGCLPAVAAALRSLSLAILACLISSSFIIWESKMTYSRHILHDVEIEGEEFPLKSSSPSPSSGCAYLPPRTCISCFKWDSCGEVRNRRVISETSCFPKWHPRNVKDLARCWSAALSHNVGSAAAAAATSLFGPVIFIAKRETEKMNMHTEMDAQREMCIFGEFRTMKISCIRNNL